MQPCYNMRNGNDKTFYVVYTNFLEIVSSVISDIYE